MSEAEAQRYASEHLRRIASVPTSGKMGLWTPAIREQYQLVEHGGVNLDDRSRSDIWFEISEENAKKLLEDSKESAQAWDFARAICLNNFFREKPLPRPLIAFVCHILTDSQSPIRATQQYNNASRNVVLSTIIFEIWALFGLSESKACSIAREAAQAANFHPPNDLIDLWRASDVKSRGLPQRTDTLKQQIHARAEIRRLTMEKLKPLESAP
ncbi:MAG: hypothetical protein AB8B71_08740 [Paracoccaceae bacterium]